jgi:hypothetical protein
MYYILYQNHVLSYDINSNISFKKYLYLWKKNMNHKNFITKLIYIYNWNIVESGVKHNNPVGFICIIQNIFKI